MYICYDIFIFVIELLGVLYFSWIFCKQVSFFFVFFVFYTFYISSFCNIPFSYFLFFFLAGTFSPRFPIRGRENFQVGREFPPNEVEGKCITCHRKNLRGYFFPVFFFLTTFVKKIKPYILKLEIGRKAMDQNI